MSKTVKINMTINDLYQIRRDCLVNDDKDTVFFCYKNEKLVKTLSAYHEGFACSRKEFESFDSIEYFNIESTITYTKSTNSCVEQVEQVEEIEQVVEVVEVVEEKQTIYHNENSDWYLISDNYVDAETVEEEGIDITQYKIVNIESSETGNNEVDDNDFWVWECQDGVFYLEEEGCFKRFESLEKLIQQFEFEKDLREEEVEYYDFNANVDYDEFI